MGFQRVGGFLIWTCPSFFLLFLSLFVLFGTFPIFSGFSRVFQEFSRFVFFLFLGQRKQHGRVPKGSATQSDLPGKEWVIRGFGPVCSFSQFSDRVRDCKALSRIHAQGQNRALLIVNCFGLRLLICLGYELAFLKNAVGPPPRPRESENPQIRQKQNVKNPKFSRISAE